MTFNVSPGVYFNEFDLSLTVPAVAATPACFSGIFRWGPMYQRILLASQNDLINRFFEPSNLNGETWFTAYNYLAYGSQLWVVRAGDHTGTTVAQVYQNTNPANSMTGSNNVVLLSNTAGINVGMKLFYSNVTTLTPTQQGGVYVTGVNSTAVTLTSSATANAGNVELIFRNNIFYTAVAQQNFIPNLQWADYNVLNPNSYNQVANTFDPSIVYVARYPGEIGNSLQVSVCDTNTEFSSTINLLANQGYINATQTYINAVVGSNTLIVTITPANTANAAMVAFANNLAYTVVLDIANTDFIQLGNNFIGFEELEVTANLGANNIVQSSANVFTVTIPVDDPFSLIANWSGNTIQRYWQYFNLLGVAPGQSSYVFNFGNTSAMDQMHVVVVDQDGQFTGTPGTVLEVYKNVSRAIDSLNPNGTTNYYANVINRTSSYIWWANDRSGAASANAAMVSSSTATEPLVVSLQYGDDGLGEANVSIGTISSGFTLFSNVEAVDISIILTGKALGIPINSNTQLATWLINNIAEERRDCVVCCSPDIADVVNNAGFEAESIITARNEMPSSSYGIMDSGYKYTYDPYNNVYRWVPLNGDIGGLLAQTDMTRAPWWSPAGFNRGNIKNVVQLAYNPGMGDRDLLYPNGVNPVVTFMSAGTTGVVGTVLYGDKTLFSEPSAFNRINVRRLFIVLEKAISTASQFFLFEFNDSFTRSQFVSMVNPYLQQIQALRGIIKYYVRCDDTNNTPYVIQNNQFVADIFIQPNYSINFIQLNFINVPPTVSFSEAESIQF